jgi:hypothetical protein
MSQTCPHGFSPAECLICRTLGVKPQVQVETSRKAPRVEATPRSQPPVRADAAYPTESPERGSPGRGSRSLTSQVVLIVLALLALGLVASVVVGVVSTLLHVLELLVVAGVAGWAGYRFGLYRGRRQAR